MPEPSAAMVRRISVGFGAMLERFAPSEAVELASYAESKGFSGTLASDHLQPWTPQQGQSAFVWTVLTSIAERTRGMFGPGVTSPGARWHPVMIAQASATFAAMYPGRYWLGIGAGEALNEHFAGQYWPDPAERSARLFEAIELIKAYFASAMDGNEVRHRGVYYRTNSLRLWTTLETPPPIIVAASGPKNARRAGEVGDGLITAGASLDKLEMLCAEFDQGARVVGRDPRGLPKMLIQHVSWAPTYDLAAAEAVRWWPNGGMDFPKGNLTSPRDIEMIAKLIEPKHFKGRVLISADLGEHAAHLQKLAKAGFSHVFLHNVGMSQRDWIDEFSKNVLPTLDQ